MDGSHAAGALLCILSALLYGLNSALAKLLALWGMEAHFIVLARGLLAALLLGCALKLRGMSLLPGERGRWGGLLVHSLCGAALTMALLNLAYLCLPVGVVTTIHYLYPLLVNLGEVLLFRAPLGRRTVAVLCAVLCGITLLAGQGGRMNGLGILLALASSVTWAFHMLYLERSALREEPPARLAFWQALASILMGALLGMLQGKPLWGGLNLKTGLLLVVSTLCALVFASSLLSLGIRKAGAGAASILSVFEPVGSVLFGALLLGELPRPTQWLGVIIILAGVLALLWKRDSTPPPSPE